METRVEEASPWKRAYKPALLITPLAIFIFGHLLSVLLRLNHEPHWFSMSIDGLLSVLDLLSVISIFFSIHWHIMKREQVIDRLKMEITRKIGEVARRDEGIDGLARQHDALKQSMRELQGQFVWTKANLLDDIVALCKWLREPKESSAMNDWARDTRKAWVRRLISLIENNFINVEQFMDWFQDPKVIKDVVDEYIGTVPEVFHRHREPWQDDLLKHVNPLPRQEE